MSSSIASNQQVQNFVDARLRPRCEQIRNLLVAIQDDIGAINDVYAALVQGTPTWTDQRTDGPPNLLTVSDILAINAMLHDVATAISGDGNYTVVLQACVRPVRM